MSIIYRGIVNPRTNMSYEPGWCALHSSLRLGPPAHVGGFLYVQHVKGEGFCAPADGE